MQMHPFARFVAILGRGKTKTRSLTVDEAEEAMSMILAGDVLPEQLGAFLMLLRIKEETASEIAGFVRAVKARVGLPPAAPKVDLDWPSYAGKKRQLPWHLLSALLLARNGVRIFMHGASGHTPGRIYTPDALRAIGWPVAESLEEAGRQIEACNFAYLPLEQFCPKLNDLFAYKAILGLRSPVHTLSRMINPFEAPAAIEAVFHPGYMEIHIGAGEILQQPRLAVFRGEGGEAERRPNKPCEVWSLIDGERSVERWPALLPEPRQGPDEDLDLARLTAVWSGGGDEYAEASVIGTAALALKLTGRASGMAEAEQMAAALWRERDRTLTPPKS
jgi:anthranilate phosphoribosyltransferase